jgi:ABC-type phosphate transport system substrate-binding protein
MRVRSAFCVLAFLCASLAPCFAHHMAVVVNKDNPVEKLTAAHLARIFRTEVRKWPDGKNLVLILHKDSPGETETLQHLNKMSAAEWRTMLTTHKDSIMVVDSDADVLKAVQADPGAIGLIDVRSVEAASRWSKSTANFPWNQATCRIK